MLRRIVSKVIENPKVFRPFSLNGSESRFGSSLLNANGGKGPGDFFKNLLKRFTNKKKFGTGGGSGPNLEPWHFIGFIAVGSLLITVYYQEYIREMFGLYPRLDFQSFSKMLSSDSVRNVVIIKVAGPNMVSHKAIVTKSDPGKMSITLLYSCRNLPR